MKKLFVVLAFIGVAFFSNAQSDKEKIEKACMDYIEGFYEGDTLKLARSLKPTLYKFEGYRFAVIWICSACKSKLPGKSVL